MKKSRPRITVLVAAAGIVLVVLIAFQQMDPAWRVLNGIRTGAAMAANTVGFGIERIFSSKSALLKETAKLKDRVQNLAIDNSEYEKLKEEFEALSRVVEYQERSPMKQVLASVISRASDFEGQTILIDRGSIDGIETGQPVVAGNGMLVGEIVKINLYTSVVQLVTDGRSKIGVSILNDDKSIGIAEGRDGVFLKISFIPQSVDINQDDLVVTSLQNTFVPSGLVLGVVREVITDEHDPFQFAFVEPLIDLRRLRIVTILTLNDL